nr:hypothetical protein [Nocardia carnea]
MSAISRLRTSTTPATAATKEPIRPIMAASTAPLSVTTPAATSTDTAAEGSHNARCKTSSSISSASSPSGRRYTARTSLRLTIPTRSPPGSMTGAQRRSWRAKVAAAADTRASDMTVITGAVINWAAVSASLLRANVFFHSTAHTVPVIGPPRRDCLASRSASVTIPMHRWRASRTGTPLIP